jgi:very-short-patch-repair endonuclease
MRRKRSKKRGNSRRAMSGKCSPAKHEFAKKLRRNMTKGEKALWAEVRQKKLGVWIYSQKIVYGYIADFWCPKAGLVIEVDGSSHKKRKAYDRKRDTALRGKGIATIRFTNSEVENNLPAVLALLRAKIRSRMK